MTPRLGIPQNEVREWLNQLVRGVDLDEGSLRLVDGGTFAEVRSEGGAFPVRAGTVYRVLVGGSSDAPVACVVTQPFGKSPPAASAAMPSEAAAQ
eukprot:gene1113-2655_t